MALFSTSERGLLDLTAFVGHLDVSVAAAAAELDASPGDEATSAWSVDGPQVLAMDPTRRAASIVSEVGASVRVRPHLLRSLHSVSVVRKRAWAVGTDHMDPHD